MRKKQVFAIMVFFMIAMVITGNTIFNQPSKIKFCESLISKNIEALTEENEEFESPTGYPFTTTCNVSIGKWRKCKVTIIVCQGGGSGCNSKKCPQHPS